MNHRSTLHVSASTHISADPDRSTITGATVDSASDRQLVVEP
jgi:hypothetical protein